MLRELSVQNLALIEDIRIVTPRQRSRRTRGAAHGARLDVRRTLRRAHRTGADPVRRLYRQRQERPRKIVLIADAAHCASPEPDSASR